MLNSIQADALSVTLVILASDKIQRPKVYSVSYLWIVSYQPVLELAAMRHVC